MTSLSARPLRCRKADIDHRQEWDPNLPAIGVRYEVNKSDLFSDSEASAQVSQRDLRRAQARRRAKA